ncbi:hypothetical protein CES86_2868 [Brucella lupini]|uniref:Uncharacterized protein n=1 Tax=Brucella lupini TaxID=255457 RepID=A0A256GNK4_9HYPH|nr:hypothetical protein CES86_2868 [Brucella lupini]
MFMRLYRRSGELFAFNKKLSCDREALEVFTHVVIGKPVSTFPRHALVASAIERPCGNDQPFF